MSHVVQWNFDVVDSFSGPGDLLAPVCRSQKARLTGMAKLSTIDMLLVNDLFQWEAGYILDFSNPRLAEFFASELGVEIYAEAYSKNGTSKANRVRCYLQTVDGSAAAAALKALWEYREAIRDRMGRDENVKDAKAKLSDLVRRLEGGKPAADAPAPAAARFNKTLLAQLGQDLLEISKLKPHPRGFAFEKFLKDLFDAYGMTPRPSFRNIGEQIDGSFMLSNEPYLMEARWQNAYTDAADLNAFHGKCANKAAWTRGLFISQTGFSQDGLTAFGREKRIICMDGLDLHDTLRRGLHLQDVLLAKVRRAGETGSPFVPVRTLFPE